MTPTSDPSRESDVINGLTRSERRSYGTIGALRSWANLDAEQVAARTAKAQQASPLFPAWHARKRFGTADNLTPDQWRRAEQDLRAWQREQALKTKVARRKRKEREEAERQGGGPA